MYCCKTYCIDLRPTFKKIYIFRKDSPLYFSSDSPFHWGIESLFMCYCVTLALLRVTLDSLNLLYLSKESGGFNDSIDDITASVPRQKSLSDGKIKQWKYAKGSLHLLFVFR